jgi:DNA gyrase subunit A
VSVLSRNTQGVTLIKLGKNEKLVGLVRLDEVEEDDFIEGEAEAVTALASPTDEAAEPTENLSTDPSVQDDESV